MQMSPLEQFEIEQGGSGMRRGDALYLMPMIFWRDFAVVEAGVQHLLELAEYVLRRMHIHVDNVTHSAEPQRSAKALLIQCFSAQTIAMGNRSSHH